MDGKVNRTLLSENKLGAARCCVPLPADVKREKE